ncbi:hypothetical protein K435DRAFT_787460, partial [Dendrothele bispora CBS 962.96]
MSSFRYTHEYSCSVQKILIRSTGTRYFQGKDELDLASKVICMLLRMKNIHWQVYSCLSKSVK